MRDLRCFLIGLASAATWPAYLILAAYAVMAAPWPRDLAWPASVVVLGVAGLLFVVNAGQMAFRKGGCPPAQACSPIRPRMSGDDAWQGP